MRSPSTSSSFTGGNLGSANAAPWALCATSAASGRVTSRLPMQPRRRPSASRVTNEARRSCERGRQATEIDVACLSVLEPVADGARGDAEQVPARFEIEALVRRLEECVGAVADHVVPGPRRVARVAHVERRRFQAAPLREVEESVHRVPPARLLVADIVVAQRHDRLRGLRASRRRALS